LSRNIKYIILDKTLKIYYTFRDKLIRVLSIMYKILSFIICIILTLPYSSYTQDLSEKDKKIQSELLSNTLPELPSIDPNSIGSKELITTPRALNIDSQEVVKKNKILPNEGKPYFTISAGLAPFQISLGILKYFITEWWGHLELDLSFFPSVPVLDYYKAFSYYKPYVAFKVITGYSFYTFKKFEMSLFAQTQFAFVSTTDIPIILGLGFRFIIDFFWLDIGFSYSITAGGEDSPVFKGFHPILSLGFRF